MALKFAREGCSLVLLDINEENLRKVGVFSCMSSAIGSRIDH
jgi:hypothetical protein